MATAAQKKAAAKWLKLLLDELNDPAVWAIKSDLAESKNEEAKSLFELLLNDEISARINTTVKQPLKKKEEIQEW